ncbi:hypothetical protein BG003_010787 [Podila horticola]|nr:hypothetical protein BG003_010787 [Podila horticola]
MDVLPPLDRPRQLDSLNWHQLVRHLDGTSPERVTKVVTPSEQQWQQDPAKAGEIWARCRQLAELELVYRGIPMLFQWAVQEKEERQQGQPKDLVLLKSVIIHQHRNADIIETTSLMAGFSETLQKLIYDNCYETVLRYNEPSVIKHIDVGFQGVMMPVLTSLAFTASSYRFRMDPLLFAQCPALQSVNIWNIHVIFDPAVRLWFEPVFLPEL